MNEIFRKVAQKASRVMGSSTAFAVAFFVILVWAITGPYYGYSDTWQLIINTGTTILTFLMVFLVQNTQNRDAKAMHLKLDELIRSVKNARNQMLDLEDLSDEEMEKFHNQFQKLSEKSQQQKKYREERSRVATELINKA